ncbi:MAG: class I SAM-dependent methyltransferase [bacterium]|nr:class I SAM-dependent methyltransferase [bacterium]
MNILLDEITENTLKELEVTQKEFWNISRKSGILINMFVKMMNIQSALEIGTSNGYSGIWIAKALKKTGGKLTTIEYFDKRQSVAVNNFKKCGVNDIIRTLQGMAIRVLQALSPDEKFDFVFIDANKSEYVDYFRLVKPHLTDKAIIIADNITSHPDKVQPFIDAIDKDNDFQYEIVEIEGGQLIAYKG